MRKRVKTAHGSEQAAEKKETLWLAHHSHMDIGYTDLADEVREQQLRHLDLAIELCERRPQNQGESAFAWTCESAWIIQDYLRMRPPRRTRRLFDLLRQGRIELQAFYTQPLTEVAGREELVNSVRYAAELGQTHDFPVECVMLNDVGGYTGRLPSVLNGWGIRYLVAGVGSYQAHMPWCELPHLFYLEDKGGGRLLVWNLAIDRRTTPQRMTFMDAVYYMGGTYLISPLGLDVMKRAKGGAEADLAPAHSRFSGVEEAFGYLRTRIRAEGYPYPDMLLQYGKDNGAPDPDLSILLAHAKDFPSLPEIRLTTPRCFFREMERRYGREIPVLRGIITDPWVVRTNAQPLPLAEHREASRRLAAAATRGVQAWLEGGSAPDDSAAAAENLQLFTDHTFGLSEWGWQKTWDSFPDTRAAAYDRYRRSWRDKARYADNALQQAALLDRTARERILAGAIGQKPLVAVWNDLARPLSGLATLQMPRTQEACELTQLLDCITGASVPFQRLEERKYLISVTDVPPFGYRLLRASWSVHSTSSTVLPLAPRPCPSILETGWLTIRLDASGEIREIVDKDGKRLAGSPNGRGFGEFRYAQLRGVEKETRAMGMGAKIEHQWIPGRLIGAASVTDGPLVKIIVRTREFETPNQPPVRVKEEIRLFPDSARIDCIYRIDKPERAAKESCYICFPFDIAKPAVRFDQSIGWVNPAEDLLAGAMQDAFYVEQWADVSGAGRGATLILPDAPVIQVGRIRTYEWRTARPFACDGATLMAWPYHNLQQTDNPIWQDLLQTVRFSVFFHPKRGFDPMACDRDAEEALFPLRAQLLHGQAKTAQPKPWLRFESSTARLNACRLLPDGKTLCLRLEERAGRGGKTTIAFDRKISYAAKVGNFFGTMAQKIATKKDGITVALKPFEIATVLVRMRPGG